MFARLATHVVNARARRGALLMDTLYPNWFSKINLSILRIANDDHCILGQVTGNTPVTQMKQKTGLSYFGGIRHGFISFGLIFADALDEAWRGEIRKRRLQPA